MDYFDYDVVLGISIKDIETEFDILGDNIKKLLEDVGGSRLDFELYTTEDDIVILKYSLTCHDIILEELRNNIELLFCIKDKFIYKSVVRLDIVFGNLVEESLEVWEC